MISKPILYIHKCVMMIMMNVLYIYLVLGAFVLEPKFDLKRI